MVKCHAAVAAALLAAPASTASKKADLFIRHATIVDVAGRRTVPDQAVAVRDDDIVAVGADAAVARRFAGVEAVDAAGKFVTPGVWDMHMHVGGGPVLIEEDKNLLTDNVAVAVT